MIQQVVAEHLGWGQAPSLDKKEKRKVNMGATYHFGTIEGATCGVVRAFWLPNGQGCEIIIIML